MLVDGGRRGEPRWGAPDVVAHETGHDAGRDARRVAATIDGGLDSSDARATSPPDAGVDAPCVPMTAAQACAGKNCGFASDGCKSGYGCGPDAGSGVCVKGQGCGAVTANVCGGCVPAEAGAMGCGELEPFTDCPIVTTDAGTGPFTPPGCIYNAAHNLMCC